MGWIKKMCLKRALFTLTLMGLCPAALLSAGAFFGCIHLREIVAPQGFMVRFSAAEPVIQTLPDPSEAALQFSAVLELLQLLLPIVFFVCAVFATSSLFYRIKLEEPIHLLKAGADRIMNRDLDFTIPASSSSDELGQLCAAFEEMRKTLLENNRYLWQQAEERKRLNAAFAHDLRNPVTVLKGTVKLLDRDGTSRRELLSRLETYTLRIEQYIEAMSSIQKLEQMPVHKKEVSCSSLLAQLRDTAELLAPGLSCSVSAPCWEAIRLDCRIFLITAENLIGNAARFAKSALRIRLDLKHKFLVLSVADDGAGYPEALLLKGPQPFGSMDKSAEHFGMGLYTCQTLCMKHGGDLVLKNGHPVDVSHNSCHMENPYPGAYAEAYFLAELV